MIGCWMVAMALAADEPLSVDYADEAELRFDLGVEAYRDGRLEDALLHLLVSHRLVPNRNVVFNIGRTYEQLERHEQAFRYFAEVVRTEPDATRRGAAEEALERIAPAVARASVQTVPAGATVYVDRRDLGSRGTTPMTVALPAGAYTLIFEHPGFEVARREVRVQEGAVVPVEVALEPVPSPAPVETAADIGPPPWAAATVRTGDAVLLRVSPTDCTLMPGVLDVSAPFDAAVKAAPRGSAAASRVAPDTLVVDWTVDDGVWRQALPRVGRRGLVLTDATGLRPLLAGCSPGEAEVGALAVAVADLPTEARRDAVALLAEWSAAQGTPLDAEVLAACARRRCEGLAAALLE